MTVRLHLFVDERGLARTLVDLWIPHLDADAAWIVGPSDRSLDPDLAREVVPILTLDPLEVAAVIAEQSASEQRVLAVFSSLDALQDAALEACSRGGDAPPRGLDRRGPACGGRYPYRRLSDGCAKLPGEAGLHVHRAAHPKCHAASLVGRRAAVVTCLHPHV